MMPKRNNTAVDSSMEQHEPYSDFTANPPAYDSPRDPSTSSVVVVASRSGNMLPVVTPSSGVPTNGVSVFTVLEPIKGL